MNRYEKAMKLSNKDFKQIIGIKKETFDAMVDTLRIAYIEKHKQGGRTANLSMEYQLFMSLKYRRQYVTQKESAFEFEVGEAATHDVIVWVENTLVKCEKFTLPGRKELLDNNEIETVLADVTESPIERPKKTAKMVLRKKETTYNQNAINCQPTNRRNHLHGSCRR